MPLTRTMADVCKMQFVSACVRVHMRTCTSRPKRLKLFGHHAHSMRLSSAPGFGLVDGFSALQPMLSFLRRCCRQQNSIKWRDGRLEWQQTHREAEVRWRWWWGRGGILRCLPPSRSERAGGISPHVADIGAMATLKY